MKPIERPTGRLKKINLMPNTFGPQRKQKISISIYGYMILLTSPVFSIYPQRSELSYQSSSVFFFFGGGGGDGKTKR